MVLPLLAAVVGAGASVYSASKQAKSAKQAAQMQADAAKQDMAMQREAYQNADRILSPYSQEGASARRMYNALLGVPSGGSTTSSTPGMSGAQAYLQANPDVAAEAQRVGWDPEAYAQWHYTTYGQNEGRQSPDALARGTMTTGAPSDLNADREMAMSAFRASPYSTIARDSATRGTNALFSTAAAMGRGVNSGKTLRAASDWNNTAQNNALVSFMGSLGGVADTGYNADSGRASGGQTFANNASNALAAQANAQAQGRLNSANAWGQGLSNAAGFIGWGAGQYGQQQPKANALYYQPANAAQTRASLPGAFNTIRSGNF